MKRQPNAKPVSAEAKDRFQNLFFSRFIGLALLLPYGPRVRFFGWVMANVAAPLAGWRARVRENLALVMPDLAEAEVERIARKVSNNIGRTLIEIYSGREFLDHIADTPFAGPGVAALEAAMGAGRSMVLITAHFGNYDVVRGGLARRGLKMGALYKPMSNKAFNPQYVRAISAIAEPVFPVGRVGVPGLVRFLRDGGSIGIVGDVADTRAPALSFFGYPAHTPLSAAELAVRFEAPLIPVFALRDDDGLHFRVHVAEPIPHGRPEDMMQAYNDVVEALVRANLDQWFWIHRRWKLPSAGRATKKTAGRAV